MTDDCSIRVAVLEAELAAIRREVGIAHNAHADLHTEANKVMDKDAELMRERLKQMNEFREEGRVAQLTYVRSDLHDQQYNALSARVSINTSRLDRFSGIWVILPILTGITGVAALGVSIAVALT
jgi:aminoglycoside phosphotransferase family enzyme